MKKPFNPVIPDYSPRKSTSAEKTPTLQLSPCCECGKPITDGYYGRFSDGGVCSKSCDILHMYSRPSDIDRQL
jgi:hypothetical protein